MLTVYAKINGSEWAAGSIDVDISMSPRSVSMKYYFESIVYTGSYI